MFFKVRASLLSNLFYGKKLKSFTPNVRRESLVPSKFVGIAVDTINNNSTRYQYLGVAGQASSNFVTRRSARQSHAKTLQTSDRNVRDQNHVSSKYASWNCIGDHSGSRRDDCVVHSIRREKQYGAWGQQLGSGLPEGIVAPQIGSTTSVAGHMIPLLTLGIPGSAATAVILAAFLLHGVQPGPLLFADADSKLMVYTIFASMFASVIGMCLIGFLWIRVVVKVLTIPQAVLSTIVVLFCLVGSFADRNSMSDVWMIVIFGVLGYLFEKFKLPISPLVLGAVLGPVGENAFMRTMIATDNDWTIFFTQPISGTLMVLAIVAVIYPLSRNLMFKLRAKV